MILLDGLLIGNDAVVGPWVQEKLAGSCEIASAYTTVGLLDKGHLVCGVLFFNARDRDLEIALYAERRSLRLTVPRLFDRVFRYAFTRLGAGRLTAEVNIDNQRCIRLACGLGFKVEGVKRRAGPQGQDKVILGLTAEDWINGQGTVAAKTDRPDRVEHRRQQGAGADGGREHVSL